MATSEGKKQPWSIHRDGACLYAAALWDEWQGEGETLLSCTIVTTAAAKAFEPWHHRMPVLLAGEEVERWLDNSTSIAADDPVFALASSLPGRLRHCRARWAMPATNRPRSWSRWAKSSNWRQSHNVIPLGWR